MAGILDADQFPGAEHAPLDYPGARPEHSYVYYRSKVYPFVPTPDGESGSWVMTESGPTPLDEFLSTRGAKSMKSRKAVVAVGSNGCPGRLHEKFADWPDVAIPVLVGTLDDTAVVYSRAVVHYGALAATYLAHPGAQSRLSVTMLTDDEISTMDGTEANYERIEVKGRFRPDDGSEVEGLTAYLDSNILEYEDKPVLLKQFAGDRLLWKKMDEREVLAAVFDKAELMPDSTIEERQHQLRYHKPTRDKLQAYLDAEMGVFTADAEGHLVRRIECRDVKPTEGPQDRNGSYVVRLSETNCKKIGVSSGNYVDVDYGSESVMSSLRSDPLLDDDTIMMDQTHRVALRLQGLMQGRAVRGLTYQPEGAPSRPGSWGKLTQPIRVSRSSFKGPSFLEWLLGYQYIVCRAHIADEVDMEKPLARLSEDSLEVVGVSPGDKVRLISGAKPQDVRCFVLNDKAQELPTPQMEALRPGYEKPKAGEERPSNEEPQEQASTEEVEKYTFTDSELPWCRIDADVRKKLGIRPWQTLLVGRAPEKIVAAEMGYLLLAVGLSAVGVILTNLPVGDLKISSILLVLSLLAIGGLTLLLKVKNRL